MEPHSLVRGTGEGGWVGMGLACGLKDQRLMARPPARAGGRSGLLTGGESGKPNGSSLRFSQRAPTHVPSPPSRWAGRYGPSNVRAAGQVSRQKYSLPPHPPPEKGVQREEPLPSGVLSPISSQEMGPRPGRPGSLPFQRRRRNPTTPPTREALVPALSNSAGKSLSHPLSPKRGGFFLPFWALSHPPLTSLPVSGTMANIVSDRGSVNGYDGKL